jgi:hypothetical protein
MADKHKMSEGRTMSVKMPHAHQGTHVGKATKHGPGTKPKGKGSGKIPHAKKGF